MMLLILKHSKLSVQYSKSANVLDIMAVNCHSNHYSDATLLQMAWRL